MKLCEYIALLMKSGDYGDFRPSLNELLDMEVQFSTGLDQEFRLLKLRIPYLVTEDDESDHPYVSICFEVINKLN